MQSRRAASSGSCVLACLLLLLNVALPASATSPSPFACAPSNDLSVCSALAELYASTDGCAHTGQLRHFAAL